MAESGNKNSGEGIGGIILVLIAGAVIGGAWISINGLIALDRVLFTGLAISPLLSWTVAGSVIGIASASGRIARSSGSSSKSNVIAALILLIFLGTGAYNWSRTEHFMQPPLQLSKTTKNKADATKKPSSKTAPAKKLEPLTGMDAVVVTERANVREEPNTSSTSDYYLEHNETVHVLSESGDWCRVRFKYEDNELEGWVHRKLLAKKDGES